VQPLSSCAGYGLALGLAATWSWLRRRRRARRATPPPVSRARRSSPRSSVTTTTTPALQLASSRPRAARLAHTHCPATQLCPVAHFTPHPAAPSPQLLGSV
jgi:hypothetical protein